MMNLTLLLKCKSPWNLEESQNSGSGQNNLWEKFHLVPSSKPFKVIQTAWPFPKCMFKIKTEHLNWGFSKIGLTRRNGRWFWKLLTKTCKYSVSKIKAYTYKDYGWAFIPRKVPCVGAGRSGYVKWKEQGIESRLSLTFTICSEHL